MPQHISRKELKTDSVQEALAHGAEVVLTHQKTLIISIIAALIVGGGIFGWRFYSQRQTVKSSAAFSQAMQSFEAPVRVAGEPAVANVTSYATDDAKYSDALKKFENLATLYPRTRSGQLAHYYAGLCNERLHKDSQAITWLSEIENSSDADFAAMARFELAQIYDREGKGDQAVALYNQLLKNPSVLEPKPVVMLALAEHYRKTDPAQAAKLYNQIKTEFPDSSAADQADQDLALLSAGKS